MDVKNRPGGQPQQRQDNAVNALTGSNQLVATGFPVSRWRRRRASSSGREGVTHQPTRHLFPVPLHPGGGRGAELSHSRSVPNAILNIVDATNLERNLYLTTQLTELGIPVVIAET